MDILIYGIGNVFNKYRYLIDWSIVIGIMDSNKFDQDVEIEGFHVKSPTDIIKYRYDYIVIFSDAYFKEIKDRLCGEFGICESKIIAYPFFFDEYILWSEESKQLVTDFILESSGAILDTDSLGYSKYRNSFSEAKRIVNYVGIKFPYQKSFYTDEKIEHYTSIMLWGDYSLTITNNTIIEVNPKQILWIVPYSHLKNKNYSGQIAFLKERYMYKEFHFLNELVYLFENDEVSEHIECKIYQVCHKQYKCVRNSMYKTIRVGNALFDSDYVDNCGDNISSLNDRLNECTAIYWIWRNMKSDYVGINHYRRQFFENWIKEQDNILSEKKIKQLLRDSDSIIVPELTRLDISILENICMSVGTDICMDALPKVRAIMMKKHPDYLESFDSVISGNVIYRCNMFVSSWKVFDDYCLWLFSFIIQLAEEIDVSTYSKQEKRVAGYFAEIMLTVWLNNQMLKIYEMPISDV